MVTTVRAVRRLTEIATFTHKVTEPDLTNVGLAQDWPGKAALTAYAGATTITTNNTVIENKTFSVNPIVQAAGVEFRGCLFQGPVSAPVSFSPVINATHSAVQDMVVEFCDLIPQTPGAYSDGIFGHDYIAERNRLERVVDGFRVFNSANPNGPSGVQILDNYVNNKAFFNPAPGQTDGSHDDDIQIEGGTGTIIAGNALHGYRDWTIGQANSNSTLNPLYPQHHSLSCVMVTPNIGVVTGLVIDSNWLYGGAPKLNISEKGRGPITGLMIVNNRVTWDNFYATAWARVEDSTYDLGLADWTENRRPDTGALVNFFRVVT